MERNKRIFVDSNYFVALFNPSDTLYQKAIRIAKKIDKEKISLAISNFIFLEVITILSQKRGKKVATDICQYFLSNPEIKLIHIDKSLQKDSWSIFKVIKNKDISFVDCSIIAAMKSEEINEILTFDKDFEKLQKIYRFKLYPVRKTPLNF